ncbi:Nhp6a non-histone chromatin component [Aphelenchoides avenae]|nr:Nhp6a non-histone chromatin component [Aphelenchus avenae]
MSVKPAIKRELVDVGNDVVEIPPRRAVAPSGNGFAVKIRDTNELSESDIRFIKPFLKLPTIIPTAPAKFTMKELPATGGWELLIDDTSTLTLMHMQSIIEIIDNRECAIQSAQGSRAVSPPQHVPKATAHAHPGIDLTGLLNGQDQNAPKRPPTAYALWEKENRPRLQKPGMTNRQVNKAVADAWKAMSHADRVPWQRLADAEKRRYVRELADYKKGQGAQN